MGLRRYETKSKMTTPTYTYKDIPAIPDDEILLSGVESVALSVSKRKKFTTSLRTEIKVGFYGIHIQELTYIYIIGTYEA